MYCDFRIDSQTTNPQGIPTWDLHIGAGGIELVTDKEGAFQRACVCTFMVRGTFKYLPLAGIAWTLMLAPPSEIDRLDVDDITQLILESYNEQEVPNYYPLFSQELYGDKKVLRVSVTDGEN